MTETITATAGAKHKQLLAASPAPLRHSRASFPIRTKTMIEKDREYPRAGVRRQHDGLWFLQLWYAPNLVRVDEDPLTYETQFAAVTAGKREAHAVRSRKHPAGQVHLRGVGMEATA